MALVRPVVAALVGLAAAAPAAWSAAIAVDSGADDGPGSLRAAIATAAATHEADAIIVVVPSLALASPLPALPPGTTLDGGGASLAPAGTGASAGLTLGGTDVTVRDLRVAGFPAGVVLAGDLGGSALLGLELEGNAVGVRDDGHTGSVRIGGPEADGNRIAGGATGVLLRGDVRVRFTRFEGVSGLAIDRGGDGATANAVGAPANHPVLESAITALGATRLTGRLEAAPGPATVDAYAATACGSRGEPGTHLAAVDVVVAPSGVARFAVTLPALPAGAALAATATGTTTSEVSPCLTPSDPPTTGAPPAPGPAGAGDRRVLAPLALSRHSTGAGRRARLTVTLSRAAVVELWIARRRGGRPLGAVVRRLPAGTTALRLPLRLDGRRLAAGRYRLTVRAVDPGSGATLDERRARFRIVR